MNYGPKQDFNLGLGKSELLYRWPKPLSNQGWFTYFYTVVLGKSQLSGTNNCQDPHNLQGIMKFATQISPLLKEQAMITGNGRF